MFDQSTTLRTPLAAPPSQPAEQPSRAAIPPTWLSGSLLALASCVLFTLACASAWLSYHAQIAYVLAHNGNQRTEAKVWALLLDTGTAGVSLLRLYETLRQQPGAATRISLLGCITASVAMNLLHSPVHALGGYLVAAVPPIMYAVFLEHLVANLRSLLIRSENRRTIWRTMALWTNFPALMWSGRRNSLRQDAHDLSDTAPRATNTDQQSADRSTMTAAEAAQTVRDEDELRSRRPARGRRGRGPGPKRIAFEAALTDQVRGGDLRLFSDNERERNAAAYQAAASLPAPLSRGTARRYVVQARARLKDAGAAPDVPMPHDPLRTGRQP